jgi:hypothetical protein
MLKKTISGRGTVERPDEADAKLSGGTMVRLIQITRYEQNSR